MINWIQITVTAVLFLGMYSRNRQSFVSAELIDDGPNTDYHNKDSISRHPIVPSIQDQVSFLSAKVDPSNIPIFEFGRDMSQILEAISNTDVTSVDPLILIEIETTFQSYMDLLKAFYMESFINYESEIGDNFNVNREEGLRYIELLVNKRDYVLTECGKAMSAAVPASKDIEGLPKSLLRWNFEGILSELRDDLTSVIQEKIDILGVQDDVDVTDTTSSSTGGYLDEPSGVDSNETTSNTGVGRAKSFPSRVRSLLSRIRPGNRNKNQKEANRNDNKNYKKKTSNRNKVAPWKKIWTKRFKWLAAQCVLLAINFAQNEMRRRTMIHSAERRLAEVPGFPLL